MSQPKISVIIPTRNAADKIEKCLEAVFAQSTKPYEVIVVDGRSTDDTVEKARKFPVKVFFQDYGACGAARQIGVENAEGEYTAFTDADCVPSRDWLKNLVAELRGDVVGVGGRIENIGEGRWTSAINLAFATFLGSGRSIQGRTFKTKKLVKSVSASNSMYRKRDLIKIGGFNPDLSGADEIELNARLLKTGKLLYVPEGAIFHDHRRGLKDFARNMYYYGGWRKESGVWDLPSIPPLLAPLLLLTLLINYWILTALIGAYLVIIGAFGLKFAIQERNIIYLVSVPIVYLIEHLCYTIGFWKEIIRPRRMRKVTEGQPL
jgi:glycosyltransferase involved in cell wall biosynthesis